MKIGGVQKSLLNLLWELGDGYDITLYLFQCTGAYMGQLPPWIRVEKCKSLFRYLGISQGECTGGQKLLRGALAALCRLLGRDAVIKLLLASQKTLPHTYDCAISFLHNGGPKSFYGGVQEFVLHRLKAKRKAAFLHCDHRNCGGNYQKNNISLAQFDVIAACSDGCREAFLEVLPELREKCVTVRNCHRFAQIRELADQSPVAYDEEFCNVVMVSRLSHEKGIQRAIAALKQVIDAGIPAMLHLVGGGGMETQLKALVQDLDIKDYVRFYGEQANPYRYLKNADLLMMTSFHEAAPMVIEEAACLGVPVLTTKTTSSQDMVADAGIGWVCENTQADIDAMLQKIVGGRLDISKKKELTGGAAADNRQSLAQFRELIGESYEDKNQKKQSS